MKVICGSNEFEMDNIVDMYSGVLYRLAMTRMGNKEDAEEVVQDTFLRLLYYIKKGRGFNDGEHLKAWLLTVAINRGKSIVSMPWNKRTEGMGAMENMPSSGNDTGYVYDYIMRLPEKYRVAIQLFYYEQYTTEQIAALMKTKPATVRSYLHRSREKLKKMMEADGYVG